MKNRFIACLAVLFLFSACGEKQKIRVASSPSEAEVKLATSDSNKLIINENKEVTTGALSLIFDDNDVNALQNIEKVKIELQGVGNIAEYKKELEVLYSKNIPVIISDIPEGIVEVKALFLDKAFKIVDEKNLTATLKKGEQTLKTLMLDLQNKVLEKVGNELDTVVKEQGASGDVLKSILGSIDLNSVLKNRDISSIKSIVSGNTQNIVKDIMLKEVQKQLSGRGINVKNLDLKSISETTFDNGCMGVPIPEAVCHMTEIPGFVAVFSGMLENKEEALYKFHIDKELKRFLLASSGK